MSQRLKDMDSRLNEQMKDKEREAVIPILFKKQLLGELTRKVDQEGMHKLLDIILEEFYSEAKHLTENNISDFKTVLKLCELRALGSAVALRCVKIMIKKGADPAPVIYFVLDKFTRHPQAAFDRD
jgi:hypothetical protein